MIVRCNSALKENNHKMMQYYEKAKPYLLTLLYLAIFIALYQFMVPAIHIIISFTMNFNKESNYDRYHKFNK